MISARPYGLWLAIIRIYTGIFWISHALQKMIDPRFASQSGSFDRLVTASIGSSSGVYRDFLLGTIQPHLTLFATVLTYLELFIGLSLILGLGTRLGALVAVLLSALYWFMSGQFATVGGYATDNAAALFLSLTCLILPVGMSLGIDGARSRRRHAPAVGVLKSPSDTGASQSDAAHEATPASDPLA